MGRGDEQTENGHQVIFWVIEKTYTLFYMILQRNVHCQIHHVKHLRSAHFSKLSQLQLKNI